MNRKEIGEAAQAITQEPKGLGAFTISRLDSGTGLLQVTVVPEKRVLYERALDELIAGSSPVRYQPFRICPVFCRLP